MTREQNRAGAQGLRRLRWSIASAWALAWMLGLSALVVLAVRLNERLLTRDLAAQLEIYATATYGLTWFDEKGRFHDEIWQEDATTWPADLDIWVVRPAPEPIFYLRPESPRFQLPRLDEVATRVLDSEDEFDTAGRDALGRSYRLYAMPTYQDHRSELPWAAVVAVGDAEPSRREHHRFIRGLLLGAVLLGLAGLVVAALLTRWSLQPVARSFKQRERFLAAAAHELRTPLATLRSVCESAAAGDEPAERAMKRLHRLVCQAGDTVDDLLLFARLEAGTMPLERQAVRLDLLVETCLPEGKDLHFKAEPLVALLDPRLIQVAVRNLLDNVRLHGGGLDGLRVEIGKGRVLMEDQGPGFPEAVLRAREVDLGLTPSRRGTGLGLTLVHLVAVLHGGALELSNSSQGGARAVIRFHNPPLRQETP